MDPVYNPTYPAANDTRWTSSSASPEYASWSSLTAGLCAGAVVGAAAALMFAPMRGAALRSSIRNYATDGTERLSGLMETGRCWAEDALQRASALIDEGRRALRTNDNASAAASYSAGAEPLTASVAEISGLDRRFEEPMGG